MNADRIAQEPYNLREWRPKTGRLFTCGRPGRAIHGRKQCTITGETIDLWVNGLPSAETLHIVSLLGSKKDGYSEFAYYPFRSSHEAGPRPTFQAWLDCRYGGGFIVHEFPTVDTRAISHDTLNAVTACVRDLLANGYTVVLMDSAEAVRTRRVCKAMGFDVLGSQTGRTK